MDKNAKVSIIEEYLIIWQQIWSNTGHKQPLYDKMDELWKSMTVEEKFKINKILLENRND